MSRAEKIVWVCFAATSAQLAFLQPYLILVPGERTNLFSGLLCLLTLLAAIIFCRRGSIRIKSPEFLVSSALLGLAVVSGLLSSTPFSASCRVFVLLASGLGGFWCARLLLNTPENQRRFEGLGLFLLAGIIILSFIGYFLSGQIEYLMPAHTHPLTNTILLLSFAPLTLLSRQSRPLTVLGIVLLFSAYVVLCLSQRVSVIFIPVGLVALGALFGALRLKHLLLVLLPAVLMVGYFSHQILWWKVSREYPTYRLENYPFSLSIAKQHPFFGIGVRAPRQEFLKDYQVKYPYDTKEKFSQDVKDFATSDNIFLTFLTDLGAPFLLIYSVALGFLFVKLTRLALRPPPGFFFPPLALLLPLAMALVHFQLYDGLLFASNSWFFHLFLGLIPLRPRKLEELATIVPQPGLSCSVFEPNLSSKSKVMGIEAGKS